MTSERERHRDESNRDGEDLKTDADAQVTPPDAVQFDEYLRNGDQNPTSARTHLAATLRLLNNVLRKNAESTTLPPGQIESIGQPCLEKVVLPERFMVRRQLGQGGFGCVYLATDTLLQRDVAIKIPHTAVTASEDLSARFLRESRALARLNHPGIVRVLDSGQWQNVPYQVAEFVNGFRLSDLLISKPMLSQRLAAELVTQLANAVQHAHENGVVHRDIKPDNILLQYPQLYDPQNDLQPDRETILRHSIVRLTDFGLARLIDEDIELSRSGMLVGTPKYMSPEQLKGQVDKQGPACDIYSLGVVLHQLLTGHVPFPEATTVHARIAVSDMSIPRLIRSPVIELGGQASSDKSTTKGSVESIGPELDFICRKCLSVDPSQRYASAAGLAEDLARFLEGRSIDGLPSSRQKVSFLIGVTAAAVLVAGAFAALQWNAQKPLQSVTKIEPAPDVTLPAAVNEGRMFQPGLSVLTTPISFDGNGPLTIEAWLQPRSKGGTFICVGGLLGVAVKRIEGELYVSMHLVPTENSYAVLTGNIPLREDTWHHVAVTFDRGLCGVFVDGEMCGLEGLHEDDSGIRNFDETERIPLKKLWQDAGTTFGSNDVGSSLKHRYPFSGRMREIRISESVLYDQNFLPPNMLVVQDTTLCLYQLSDQNDSFPDLAGRRPAATVYAER